MGKKKKQKKSKKITKGRKISNIIIRLLSFLILIVLGVMIVLFLKNILELDMLPMKYFKIGALVLIGFELLYALICINKKKAGVLLILIDILAIGLIVVQWFGVSYIDKTQTFLKDNLMKEYEADEFYLVANADSSLSKAKELDGGEVYYNVDTDHYKKLKEGLKKLTSAKIEETESLADSLVKLSYPENVVILNSGIYQSITDNDPVYGEHLKIIDTITVYVKKTKKEKNENAAAITTEPFIIYLSGIDTRGKNLVKKSLSDVNMLITINPKTKTILLVSIPRDSYVQLHGYRGKDKLTYAGSLGGVELSKATVEDLMGVHANYYARVNFKAVINLVDAVGGVTVEEDPEVKKRFKAYTNGGCWIEPGVNNFNGECALAFARERYHYSKGDMQRNINQQKVLKALFNKMSTNTYTVAHYTDLLNALDGTFETDMSMEEIAALVKFQLNDMSPWTFESQNVVGGTGRTTTLSSGSTELSVVYPNQNSINEAKEAIRKVIAGESLHPEENTTTE